MTAIAIVIVYFIPSLNAVLRKKKNKGAIILVNLLFGWTLVGWLWALIWSVMND